MTDDEEINACIAAIEEAFAAAKFVHSTSIAMGCYELSFNPRSSRITLRNAMAGSSCYLSTENLNQKISMIQLMPKLYDALKEANSRVANAKLTTLALVKQITKDLAPETDIHE